MSSSYVYSATTKDSYIHLKHEWSGWRRTISGLYCWRLDTASSVQLRNAYWQMA